MSRREQSSVSGLLSLDAIRDAGGRRAAFRGGLAALARSLDDDLPSPLEGRDPAKLVENVKASLALGLFDDLEWLPGGSAGAVLYELAQALPPGAEKRELGRRVLGRLYDGDAATFVAAASRMAMGSAKAISGEALRARVALSCIVPTSANVGMDRLALVLLTRRELARDWVGGHAVGSLPDRRLSGRLIEHAARAIARRAAQGDDGSVRVLSNESISMAMRRLLADREPLVWRHAAIARGLLVDCYRPAGEQVDRGFATTLTPTEWRRAATSLAASIAVRPDAALRQLREVLKKGLLTRDPGAASAFVWGVGAGAEVEPEAAEELLDLVVAETPLEAAEALAELITRTPGFGLRAAKTVAAALAAASSPQADDGAIVLRVRLLEELDPDAVREGAIVPALESGIRLYAESGARAAYAKALEALELAKANVATLDALRDGGEGAKSHGIERRAAFGTLRDLDIALLEDGTLRDLLLLGGKVDGAAAALGAFETLHDRITDWVVDREHADEGVDGKDEHPILRMRRVRTLLHLADARTGDDTDEAPSSRRARTRCSTIGALALRRLAGSPPGFLHRPLCAAFARASDALVRDGSLDPADALLVVIDRGLGVNDLTALAEASMNPDLTPLLGGWTQFLIGIQERRRIATPSAEPSETSAGPQSVAPPSMMVLDMFGLVGRDVEGLARFARDIEGEVSAHAEAARASFAKLAKALGMLLSARSLPELARSDGALLQMLETAVNALASLFATVRARFSGPTRERAPAAFAATISSSINDRLRGAEDGAENELAFVLAQTREELAMLLPPILCNISGEVLKTLAALPKATPVAAASADEVEAALPQWLPPRRTLGGFYVVRAIGSGAGGTVFVARRTEDRHDAKAETFAMKVPDYDSTAARSLSETEFLTMFRSEASALLGLPQHHNIARFVTFDTASRPKPILVMELVEGVSLERLVESGGLDLERAFFVLAGILDGLGAMHAQGVGHLDVKPSNVILRPSGDPVLVDFGLAGRNIRPGCGTGSYGAPEVWGYEPENGEVLSPARADIYAFGCTAFEVLTSHTLIDGPSEMALVAAHFGHDGNSRGIQALAAQPELRPVAEWLSRALRRDPKNRATAAELRAAIPALIEKTKGQRWPLRIDL